MPRERHRYTLEELLKNADPEGLLSPEMREMLDMPPVGLEFGSGSPEDPAGPPDAPSPDKKPNMRKME